MYLYGFLYRVFDWPWEFTGRTINTGVAFCLTWSLILRVHLQVVCSSCWLQVPKMCPNAHFTALQEERALALGLSGVQKAG